MARRKKPARRNAGDLTPTSPAPEPFYLRFWFPLTLLGLLFGVLVAFGGAVEHDFVAWDDHVYVYENPLILGPSAATFRALATRVVSLNYHPLTMWTLWANSALFGPGPRSFIATNIVIHWLNAGLLCWLAWLLTERRSRAVPALTAFLFAVHPLRAESVVWVSERKDVLYVFFFLAGLILYWDYLLSSRKRLLGLATGLMLMACLSKGVAVVFPVVCLLLDFWKQRRWSARLVLEKLPMFSLSLLFGLIALDVQRGGDFHGLLDLPSRKVVALSAALGPGSKIFAASYGFTGYFIKTFVPTDLCTFYPYPAGYDFGAPRFIGSLAFLVASAGVFIWGVRRAPILAFGFGWIFATVALVLQLISVGAVIMADRYFYLPSAGLFFMLTYGGGAPASSDQASDLEASLATGGGLFPRLLPRLEPGAGRYVEGHRDPLEAGSSLLPLRRAGSRNPGQLVRKEQPSRGGRTAARAGRAGGESAPGRHRCTRQLSGHPLESCRRRRDKGEAPSPGIFAV